MAAAAIGAAGVAGKTAAVEGAGVIKTLLEGLNKSIVSVHVIRNPKNYKKMQISSIDINITAGLIIGAAGLAILWEIANWFAQSGAGGGTPGSISTDLELVGGPAGWITLGITDLLGNPVLNSDGSQKTATGPGTFGAAYNQMLRNLTLAGPGQAASSLLNLVAAHLTP